MAKEAQQQMDPAEEMRLAQIALQAMMKGPPSTKKRALDHTLTKNVDMLEELLPETMKGQGMRLIKRALLTFERNPGGKLNKCTPASFIYAVLEAAELGLPIDGRLCYAVPYNTKFKDDNNRDQWEYRAKAQPSYLGLVAVAKRSKQILDCYGAVICQNDDFKHGRSGPTSVLEHTYDVGARGDVVGAWAIVTLPDGTWRYEIMDFAEIEAIRGRSKSKDDGPWVTDADQMRVKTVIRRILKLYCDDPAVTRAMDLDDDDFVRPDPDDVPTAGVAERPRSKAESLIGRMGGNTDPPSDRSADRGDMPSQSRSAADDEPEQQQEQRQETRGEQQGMAESSVIVAQIQNAATAAEVSKLYDLAVGPDSAQEFSIEESNAIAAARDRRLLQLKSAKDAAGSQGKDAQLFNKGGEAYQ